VLDLSGHECVNFLVLAITCISDPRPFCSLAAMGASAVQLHLLSAGQGLDVSSSSCALWLRICSAADFRALADRCCHYLKFCSQLLLVHLQQLQLLNCSCCTSSAYPGRSSADPTGGSVMASCSYMRKHKAGSKIKEDHQAMADIFKHISAYLPSTKTSCSI
jgi:hypothetical protein